MQLAQINTIDTQLSNWLVQQRPKQEIGTIHSVFDRVINIMSADESRFFSIASADLIQAPQMMQTDDRQMFSHMQQSAQTGDPVMIAENHRIRAGGVSWSYHGAMAWNGTLSSGDTGTHAQRETFLKSIRSFIFAHANDGGLRSAYLQLFSSNHTSGGENLMIYTNAFFENLQNLDRAIQTGSEQDILQAGNRFVGLGVGLTPSGDDFLLGCLTLWQYFRSPLFPLYQKNHWIEKVRERTTTFSYFMLDHCINGFVNDAFVRLCKDWQNTCIHRQLEAFLKIGSTSGLDMLIGACFALQYTDKEMKQ